MDVYTLATHIAAPFTGDISNVSTWLTDAAADRNPFAIAELLAQTWHDTIMDSYLALLGQDCVLEAISCRRINSLGGPTFTQGERKSGTNIGGTVGDTALSCVISWVPEEPLWQYGHEYIPCVPASNMMGNSFDDQYVLDVSVYANLERVGLSGGVPLTTFTRCIYERKTKTGRKVQSFEVKPKPASLSRRLAPYG